MADSGKIGFEDLFDGKDLIKRLDAVSKALGDIAAQQEKILKQSQKSTLNDSAEIEKTNQALQKSKAARQGINEIEAERLKLEKKLKVANSDRIQDNEELKVLLTEQRKTNKQLARESLGLVGAYEKQSKRLIALRAQYKDLAISEGLASKEAKQLLKELKKLDEELKEADASAGQFQRNVGNYPKSLNEAASSLLKTAAAAATLKGAFDGAKGSLEATEQGSEAVRKVSSALGGAFDQVKNVVASTALDLGRFARDLFNGEKSLGDITEAFTETSKAAEDFGDKVVKSATDSKNLEQTIIDLEKSLRPLEERIAVLNGEIEKQSAIAGDSTRSFNEIEEAAIRAQNGQLERAKIRIDIAEQELAVQRERVRIANEAGGAGVELLDQETAAIIKLQEVRNEFAKEQIETAKILRETARDRFERELDFAIDAFDAEKTVNERLIADNRRTLDQRRKILETTIALTDSSFQSQISLVQGYTKQKIDLDALVAESDERVIRSQLRRFNFDDVTLGRILEIIRERKLALQDLADAEREISDEQIRINQAVAQSFVQTQDLLRQQEIFTLEEQLNDQKLTAEQAIEINERLFNLRRDSIIELAKLEKNQAEQSIVDENERVAEIARIKEEERLALLQLESERAKATKAIRDKELEEFKQNATQLINAVASEVDKINALRADSLADELNRREQELQTAEQRLQAGLDSQIAFAQRKRDEAALAEKEQQERARKQQEALALSEAFIEAYTARLQEGENPATASAKAFSDTLTAKALARVIAGSALEGTEDTGTIANKGLDGKGGRLWMLHDNERVLTKEQNEKIGALSNGQLADIAMKYQTGELVAGKNDSAPQIIAAINRLEGTMKQRPVQQVNVDQMNNLIETIYQDGMKTVVVHKRKTRI